MASSAAMFNLESSSISFSPPSLIVANSTHSSLQDIVNHNFHPIELPGENYFPVSLVTKVIARYEAPDFEYNAESWAKHVLEQASTSSECNGVASFSAINTGSTGGRCWFGYAHNISLSSSNFEEKADVEGARAYRNRDFQAKVLLGENYVPGSALSTKIMAGYHADYSQHDAKSWANYVLEQCKALPECKGIASYSAINSGSTGGRYWLGYAFRTTVSSEEFELKEGAEGAQAYGDRTFHRVDLPGDDYVADGTLFPENVIAGYYGSYSAYNADSWVKYVLAQCQSYSACTVVSSFSAINSGNTGGRYWFGYIHRGGRVGSDAFMRGPEAFEIQGARAYSI